jgi:hypothetical protein
MSELVFFLEEASAKAMLEKLVPRIVPQTLVLRFFLSRASKISRRTCPGVCVDTSLPMRVLLSSEIKTQATVGKARYRDPDSIESPSRELRRIVSEYQKVDGSRRIGELIDPNNQKSRSFVHLVDEIKTPAADIPAL